MFWTLCNNTGVTGDRDILIMSTVVTAPAVVSTLCEACFCAIAADVVQPDLSTDGAVAMTNQPSTVSVCRVTNDKWLSLTQ